MAILRRLLAVLALSLAVCAGASAQATTQIDGSQNPLVIVQSGQTVGGWIWWRAKYLPAHVIFSFELPANFTAVNPVVRCSLDDASTNPNDLSRWVPINISLPINPASNPAFDVVGPSVGTVAQPATTVLVETGVFPCVEWAIAPAGINNTFTSSGNSKVMAVQLPSSGDASFLNGNNNTTLVSGSIRVMPSSNNGGAGVPNGTVTIAGSQNQPVFQDVTNKALLVSAAASNFALADGSGNTANFPVSGNQGDNPFFSLGLPYYFNGTTWDRQHGASAANNGTTTGGLPGIGLNEKGPRWSQNSAPASGTQGSAVQAAGGAGIQHIADCITFSAASNAAPAATALNVQLLDGASIKAEWQIEILAAAGQNTPPFQACGLNIIGTANTSMTLQWSAGLANLVETATITGFDVK